MIAAAEWADRLEPHTLAWGPITCAEFIAEVQRDALQAAAEVCREKLDEFASIGDDCCDQWDKTGDAETEHAMRESYGMENGARACATAIESLIPTDTKVGRE